LLIAFARSPSWSAGARQAVAAAESLRAGVHEFGARWLELSRHAAESALKLNPKLGLAHAALGTYEALGRQLFLALTTKF
jgi:hypothetical protein